MGCIFGREISSSGPPSSERLVMGRGRDLEVLSWRGERSAVVRAEGGVGSEVRNGWDQREENKYEKVQPRCERKQSKPKPNPRLSNAPDHIAGGRWQAALALICGWGGHLWLDTSQGWRLRETLQGGAAAQNIWLCGSPSDKYWKKFKFEFPNATIIRPQQLYKRCIKETFKDFPPSSLPLVETLLAIDPAERLTATAALNSEFFATEPYACEPSILLKYPPRKVMDVKLQNEEARRGASKAKADMVKRIRLHDQAVRAFAASEARLSCKPIWMSLSLVTEKEFALIWTWITIKRAMSWL